MSWLHIFLLALIQGITEFLPISSSAHLILLPLVLKANDQGLAIDLSAHLGSLLAVIFYFREDSKKLFYGMRDFTLFKSTGDASFFKLIFIATIPIVILGFMVESFAGSDFRSSKIIAFTTIAGAILLWLSDNSQKGREINELNYKDALIIGCFQILSLVPGTSRSGITMTAGRFLKFNRLATAKFSLILSIPTTFAAIVLVIIKMLFKSGHEININLFVAVTILSAISAYLTLSFLMKWLKFSNFLPFVIYRIILGFIIIVWLL